MTAEALPSVDGRRARRDQNRERVVDALLALYREGEMQPAVADVAARSGVSHRSVFRYFEDLDELYRVAIERQYEAITDHLHISEIGRGPLDDRIERIVENRLDLYDAAAPVARVGRMRAPLHPVLLDHLRDNAARTCEQVRRHFAPELAALPAGRRNAVTEAVGGALAMEAMELYRFVRGLTRDETGAVLRETIGALLRGGPA